MRLGARVSTIRVLAGARRVHYILLDMADALCEAKCVDQGISAKCISALVTMMFFSEDGVDVVSARALIALAFECDDDTVLADLLSSAC
jgi:hypothetical protein